MLVNLMEESCMQAHIFNPYIRPQMSTIKYKETNNRPAFQSNINLKFAKGANQKSVTGDTHL